MSRLRIACAMALVTCLLLGGVLPASATEKLPDPAVSYKTDRIVIHPGIPCDVKLNLSSPGFLSAVLQTEDGEPLDTLFENLEVASGEFYLPWKGYIGGTTIPEPGKYKLSLVLRNEYGVESKPANKSITIEAGAPIIENVRVNFQPPEGFGWTFTYTTNQPGEMWADLHPAGDLENVIAEIYAGPHEGGEVSFFWSAKVYDDAGDGVNTIESDVYPGRYAVKIYTKNAEGVESEGAILFVTVDAYNAPHIANAEGEYVGGEITTAQAAPPAADPAAPATDPNAVDPAAVDPNAVDLSAAGPAALDPNAADPAVDPNAADPAADPNAADPAAVAPNAVDPNGTNPDPAGEGEAPQQAAAPQANPNAMQLGRPLGGASLVSPEEAAVGVGVGDYVQQAEDNFWNLETGAMDDAALWNAIIKPMYVCKLDESEHFYPLDNPNNKAKRLGEMHGTTAGVNILRENKDGWALVECYRNEDGAFIRGWVNKGRLKEVTPNQEYGLVLDKNTQTLTLFHNGQRVDTILVSTGLAEAKKKDQETPAGEYILGSRVGSKKQAGIGYCDFHLRINGGILLHGQPYTESGGSKVYEWAEFLGTKATRNTVVVQSEPNPGQTFCMEQIWNDLPRNMKVLVLDDKDRSEIPFK